MGRQKNGASDQKVLLRMRLGVEGPVALGVVWAFFQRGDDVLTTSASPLDIIWLCVYDH